MINNHKPYLLQKISVQVLLIIISTVAVYLNSFEVPFQFDDILQIKNNDFIQKLSNFSNLKYWLNVNNRPFAFFTLALNYSFHENEVLGYHLLNLMIHIFTSIVVLLFVRKIQVLDHKADSKINYLFPLAVAVLFAIHVVQVQAVTYIVQRMTSLAALFYISSAYLYMLARESYFKEQTIGKYIGLLILSMLSGVLGIMSKQNVVVFPLAILLTEIFFIRNNNGKVCKKYIIAVSSILVVFALIYILKLGLPYETLKVSRTNYLFTQFFVIPRYFQMMLVPVGLSIDHDIAFANGFLNSKVIFGLLINSAIIISAFLLRKKIKLYSFGIFWIYIALIVESSIIPIQDAMFEHRMYLPLLGFNLAVLSLFFRFVASTKIQNIVLIALFLLMSIITIVRNNHWNDGVSLWKEVTENYPDHERGWIGLAYSYDWEKSSNVDKIIYSYEQALNINPKNEKTLYDLSMVCIEGKREEKANKYAKLLVYSTNNKHSIQALNYLGANEYKNGNLDASFAYFNSVIEKDSNNINALKFISVIYLDQKKFDLAKKYSNQLVELVPNQKIAYYYLGKACFNLGEMENTIESLKKYLQLDANNVEVILLYASASINLEHYQEAKTYLDKAYELTNDQKILDFINQLKEQYLSN